MFWPKSEPTYHQIVYTGLSFFCIYTYISVFLFSSLGWITKIMLNILVEQVTSKANQNLSRENWQLQFKTWRRHYFLIGELVYYINCCFGPHLFLVLGSTFIKMVNNSFTLLSLIKTSYFDSSNFLGLYLLFNSFVQDFAFIGVITYVPHSIRQMVCINFINIIKYTFVLWDLV